MMRGICLKSGRKTRFSFSSVGKGCLMWNAFLHAPKFAGDVHIPSQPGTSVGGWKIESTILQESGTAKGISRDAIRDLHGSAIKKLQWRLEKPMLSEHGAYLHIYCIHGMIQSRFRVALPLFGWTARSNRLGFWMSLRYYGVPHSLAINKIGFAILHKRSWAHCSWSVQRCQQIRYRSTRPRPVPVGLAFFKQRYAKISSWVVLHMYFHGGFGK